MRLDERISHADIPLETVLSITRPRLHTRVYHRSSERDMPPISELTATSGNSAPRGTGHSEGEDAFIVYMGGATGHPRREQLLHQRHRAEQHQDQEHQDQEH